MDTISQSAESDCARVYSWSGLCRYSWLFLYFTWAKAIMPLWYTEAAWFTDSQKQIAKRHDFISNFYSFFVW